MSNISDSRRGDLEALADKSTLLAVVLGALLGPLGYVYVGSWRWAVINFFTLNYLLLGIVLVPLHTAGMILGARSKLRRVDRDEDAETIWSRFGSWYAKKRY
jgi:MFS family permease